jgi:hypothetical protein
MHTACLIVGIVFVIFGFVAGVGSADKIKPGERRSLVTEASGWLISGAILIAAGVNQ